MRLKGPSQLCTCGQGYATQCANCHGLPWGESPIKTAKSRCSVDEAAEAALKALEKGFMHFPDIVSEGSGGLSSKNFVKLKDRESVTGVFRGDVHTFKQHWVENRSSVCSGQDCKLCKEGIRAGFRFRLNFVMKDETNTLVAKIFDQSYQTYCDLKSLHESGYDLSKTFVKITRHGSMQQTQYNVIPLPNGAVTPDKEAMIAKVQLHDLPSLDKQMSAQQPHQGVHESGVENPPTNFQTMDDIPF